MENVKSFGNDALKGFPKFYSCSQTRQDFPDLRMINPVEIRYKSKIKVNFLLFTLFFIGFRFGKSSRWNGSCKNILSKFDSWSQTQLDFPNFRIVNPIEIPDESKKKSALYTLFI